MARTPDPYAARLALLRQILATADEPQPDVLAQECANRGLAEREGVELPEFRVVPPPKREPDFAALADLLREGRGPEQRVKGSG